MEAVKGGVHLVAPYYVALDPAVRVLVAMAAPVPTDQPRLDRVEADPRTSAEDDVHVCESDGANAGRMQAAAPAGQVCRQCTGATGGTRQGWWPHQLEESLE
jgi:hypothetical protein